MRSPPVVALAFVIAVFHAGAFRALAANPIFCQGHLFGPYPQADQEFRNLRIPFTTQFYYNWPDWRKASQAPGDEMKDADLNSTYRRHVQTMIRCIPLTAKSFQSNITPRNLAGANLSYDEFREVWLENYAKPLVRWAYESGIYLIDLGLESYPVEDGVPESKVTSVRNFYPYDDTTGDLLKTAADVKWRINDSYRKLMEWKNRYYPKVIIIFSMHTGFDNTVTMDMASKDASENITASFDWAGPELPTTRSTDAVDMIYGKCVPYIENPNSSAWGMANMESLYSITAHDRYAGRNGNYLNYNTPDPKDTIALDYSDYSVRFNGTVFMDAMEHWLTKPYFMFHNEAGQFVSDKFSVPLPLSSTGPKPEFASSYSPHTVIDSPEALGTVPTAWNMDANFNASYFDYWHHYDRVSNTSVGPTDVAWFYRGLYNRWGPFGHDPDPDPYKSRYWYYRKMMFNRSYNYNTDSTVKADYRRSGKPANFADRWTRTTWPLVITRGDIRYDAQRGIVSIALRNLCADKPLSAPIRIYERELDNPPWNITGSIYKKATPANVATVLSGAAGLVRTISEDSYSVPGNGDLTTTNNVVTLSIPYRATNGREIYVAVEDTSTVKGWHASNDIPWCGPVEKTAGRAQVIEWDLHNSILPAGQTVQVQIRARATDPFGSESSYSAPSLVTIVPADGNVVNLSCDATDSDGVAVHFEYSLDGTAWMAVQQKNLLTGARVSDSSDPFDRLAGHLPDTKPIDPYQNLFDISDPGFEKDSTSAAAVGRNGSAAIRSSSAYYLTAREIGNGLTLGRDTLTLRVFARSPNNARLGIQWVGYDRQGAQIATATVLWNQILSGQYQSYEKQFELNDARIDWIRLRFYRSNDAGTIFVDDLTVESATISRDSSFEHNSRWNLLDSLLTRDGLDGSQAIRSNPLNATATALMARQNFIGRNESGYPFLFDDSPIKISVYAKGDSGARLGIRWLAYNTDNTVNELSSGITTLWNLPVTTSYQRYNTEFSIPSNLPKDVNYLMLEVYRLGIGSLYVDECRLLNTTVQSIASQKGEYVFWGSGGLMSVPKGVKALKFSLKAKGAKEGKLGAYWLGYDSTREYSTQGHTGFWNVDPGPIMKGLEHVFTVADPSINRVGFYLYHSNVASNPDGKVWFNNLTLQNITPRNYLWDGDFEMGGKNWSSSGGIVLQGVADSRALLHQSPSYEIARQDGVGLGQSLRGARFRLSTTAKSPNGGKLGFYWRGYRANGTYVAQGSAGVWDLPLTDKYATFSGEFTLPAVDIDEITLLVYRSNYSTRASSTLYIDEIKLLRK